MGQTTKTTVATIRRSKSTATQEEECEGKGAGDAPSWDQLMRAQPPAASRAKIFAGCVGCVVFSDSATSRVRNRGEAQGGRRRDPRSRGLEAPIWPKDDRALGARGEKSAWKRRRGAEEEGMSRERLV
ncbi:hypothetical protein KM043_017222 [Ampulex compressa]|nr:hypothetical protein KM043_017222 [Ampulex compressa]